MQFTAAFHLQDLSASRISLGRSPGFLGKQPRGGAGIYGVTCIKSKTAALSLAGNSSQSNGSSVERDAKKLERIVLALAFLAQCIGSIFLCHRRRQHLPDAITIADQRVFELACGGLLVAVLTLGTVAKFPLFNTPIPEEGTGLDVFVIQCRESRFYIAWKRISYTPPNLDK